MRIRDIVKIEQNMMAKTFYKQLGNWDRLLFGTDLTMFQIFEHFQNECSLFQREEAK